MDQAAEDVCEDQNKKKTSNRVLRVMSYTSGSR